MIPDLPQAVGSNIQEFTGRTWLLPRLLGWLEHPDGHLFLVTGRPAGHRKSARMASLAGSEPAPADQAASSQLERIRG